MQQKCLGLLEGRTVSLMHEHPCKGKCLGIVSTSAGNGVTEFVSGSAVESPGFISTFAMESVWTLVVKVQEIQLQDL